MDLELKTYIDSKLEKISQDISRELANLKASLFQNTFRTEAHLRGALVDGRISLDRQLEYFDGYQLFRIALKEVLNEPFLEKKIKKIQEFNNNKNTDFIITLDDTDILQYIENVGNTVSEKLFQMLVMLPMSKRTQLSLTKVLVATGSSDKKEGIAPKVKYISSKKKKKR